MTQALVTVFGGTGFLGRAIVKTLCGRGMRVRIAVRNPCRATPSEETDLVSFVPCDVRDEASVAAALAGATGAINAVGQYTEHGAATFDAIHVQGAEYVARQADRAGVEKLVHISGIGADPESRSPYVRSRARGEVRVRHTFESAAILRPSVLFGPGDSFLNALADILRRSPVFPLFGTGDTRLQPVFVDDIAEATTRAVELPALGTMYELGGPRVYTYRALAEVLAARIERRRLLLPVPFFVWKLAAKMLAALPNPPLTQDQVVLMEKDNVVGPRIATFADLKIEPRALEELLPACLA